jgi:Spy/CpxP family protein refolding chaperone
MMIQVCRLVLMFILLPVLALAQKTHQPYAGQEHREIKTLSPEEIKAYLEGQGMGFAKAAELNHYPGPKHVLELAAELQLSQEQKIATQAIYDNMHHEAVRRGKQIVEHEKKLDELFASGEMDRDRLVAIVNEISRLQGEARIIHLQAHLEMKQRLTVAQIAKYDELRGYGTAKPREMHHHQHGNH